MLTVEKIGGTSMSALEDVITNIICYYRTGDELYNRVFVVSAFSGVTNLLLEDKKTKAPGGYKDLAAGHNFREKLNEVAAYLKSLNKSFEPLGLDVKDADDM